MLKLLTFTNLYPNPAEPRHGIFVEQRLRRLVGSGAVQATVVAPVPWVPLPRALRGRVRSPRGVPRTERRHGIAVWHPRFLTLPGLCNWINPILMALGALSLIRHLQRRGGDFDVIDAHFLYPDGAAAVLLGAWLGKPVLLTARGSDVNVMPQFRVQRAWIRWAIHRAAAVITVSDALRRALLDLGAPPERVRVLRNGVDLELFQPRDAVLACKELGLPSRFVLSIGNLVDEKGHHLVIEALASMPGINLVLIGSGSDEAKLRTLARRHGVDDRISWISHVAQEQLSRYYSAADATILASSREGMPNVVLESLACGTPVIASAVGGTPEVITAPVAGTLLPERTASAIAAAWKALSASPPERFATRRYAEQFGWREPIEGQLRLLASVTGQPAAAMPAQDASQDCQGADASRAREVRH